MTKQNSAKRQASLVAGVAVSALLSGCQLLVAETDWCVSEDGKYQKCGNVLADKQPMMAMVEMNEQPPKHVLDTKYNHKALRQYVEQMALKMTDSMETTMVSPIAVTSFVHLDSTLKRTNVLGNQIAESFVHELQAFGLPVVDFKTTGNVDVTPVGDFAFSRHYEELTPVQNIGYVLSGTMIERDGGYVVNARIVGVKSKVVLASARGYIPAFIVSDMN